MQIQKKPQRNTYRGLPIHELDVCYWHKADMLNALTNVRFGGKTDMTRT